MPLLSALSSSIAGMLAAPPKRMRSYMHAACRHLRACWLGFARVLRAVAAGLGMGLMGLDCAAMPLLSLVDVASCTLLLTDAAAGGEVSFFR